MNFPDALRLFLFLLLQNRIPEQKSQCKYARSMYVVRKCSVALSVLLYNKYEITWISALLNIILAKLTIGVVNPNTLIVLTRVIMMSYIIHN